MRIKHVVAISISFLTVLSLYQDEATARPADKVVQLIVREAPEDPGSPIIQTASIGLMKYYTGAGYIEWEPVSVTIHEVDEFGNVLATWRGTDVSFDTVNGLWPIKHLDTLAPADTEFALPPFLLGTAFSDDPSLFPWDFEILGDLLAPLFSDTGTGEPNALNSGTSESNPPEEPFPGPEPDPEPDPEPPPDDQPFSD